MSKSRKKIKTNPKTQQILKLDFNKLYEKIIQASKSNDDHIFGPLLKAHQLKKMPILQVIQPQTQVYKVNPEKRKRPIQQYLQAINHIYKKRDLDILIGPVTPSFAFEKWAPRQIAIFEEAILRFGKQFQLISEMLGSKNVKEVYQFYLQWKSTTHYKSYKSHVGNNSKSSLEDYV